MSMKGQTAISVIVYFIRRFPVTFSLQIYCSLQVFNSALHTISDCDASESENRGLFSKMQHFFWYINEVPRFFFTC